MAGFTNTVLAPFTVKGFYLLTWGTALGSNVWNTVVSDMGMVRDYADRRNLLVSCHSLPPTRLTTCIARNNVTILPTTPTLHSPPQSGYKTYKSLPRQTFGTLQSRLQPLYFSFQTLTSATLLLTHLWFHPALISSPLVEPHWATCEEGRQGLLIVAALASSAVNWLIVGPWASSVMFERHRLERVEGKEYDEPNVSVVW